MRIDSVEVSARGATYRGVVFDDERHSLPLTLTASRVGKRVDLRVTVPGADLVVLHAARQPLTVGVPPRLPARNLRERVWWAAPQTGPDQPAFTTLLGYTVGIDADAPPPWTCGRSAATKYTSGARRCACRVSRTRRVRLARSDA